MAPGTRHYLQIFLDTRALGASGTIGGGLEQSIWLLGATAP
jgi:hypothetical protein